MDPKIIVMSFLWIYRKQDYLKMGAATLERLQKKRKERHLKKKHWYSFKKLLNFFFKKNNKCYFFIILKTKLNKKLYYFKRKQIVRIYKNVKPNNQRIQINCKRRKCRWLQKFV